MVKVFIKGGVWKNSEDEILKAAVMKYGKQNWARVASLLNRKSAKQCKARWHEWLDPSIKKVEWSREEEEKLLHLAKLMPAQWKTIGPIVGRTATQCQEHYEELLDEAAGGSSGARRESQQQHSYQPGQIDSAPETKPARPDPMDMDEDEMEMLQEARARLANTQGKKAKRKAREKMLAQAKRLAELQKRRELKQAGLLSGAAAKKSKKRKKEIDYGVEIPFHKPAPAGFHDTSQEDERANRARQKRLKAVDYKQVNENQYRTRDREAMQAKKREEARLRLLESSNMQYVVAQVSQQNDAPQIQKKRPALNLPAPSVSDQELSQLSKMQQAQQDGSSSGTGDAGVTQALLGDYSDRPLPTPMRATTGTPGVESKHASMLREASQMRRLQEGQTPLLHAAQDSQEVVMEELEAQKQQDASSKAFVDAPTPMHSSGTRRGANKTPLLHRDALGLNNDDGAASVAGGGGSSVYGAASSFGGSISIRDFAREERRAAKRARKELEAALASLPAPQFEYELALPDEGKEEKEDVVKEPMIADQADLDKSRLEKRRKEAEKLHAMRSTVLKRSDLPRPTTNVANVTIDDDEDETSRLILNECKLLMLHDAQTYPIAAAETKKSKRSKKRKATQPSSGTTAAPTVLLDFIPQQQLERAKQLLHDEFEQVVKEKKANIISAAMAGSSGSEQPHEDDVEDIMVAANVAASRDAVKGLYWNGRAGYGTHMDKKELEKELTAIRNATAALAAKNKKTESKLAVKLGGYVKRAQKLEESIQQQYDAMERHVIELAVFEQLQSQEVQGAARRIANLRQDVAKLEQDNAEAQRAYGDLLLEKKRLMIAAREKERQKSSLQQKKEDDVPE